MFVSSTYVAKDSVVEDGDPVPLLSNVIVHPLIQVIQVLSLAKFAHQLHLLEGRRYLFNNTLRYKHIVSFIIVTIIMTIIIVIIV